jgi:hypothetical protein
LSTLVIHLANNLQIITTMKKLIIAASMLLAFTSFSFAQTAPAKPAQKTTAKKESVSQHSATSTAPAQTSGSKSTTTTTGPLKKDGTPDKRYKANDATTTSSTHVKKDGTLDKRYKENKKP